jgi:hypothetical protein
MKIIDPLPPVLLFLSLGAIVLVIDTRTTLVYVVLIALLLAAVFGSVIWFQRGSSDEKPHPERK